VTTGPEPARGRAGTGEERDVIEPQGHGSQVVRVRLKRDRAGAAAGSPEIETGPEPQPGPFQFARASSTAEGLLDRDLEAGDDSRVAASREQLGIGIAGRHPCVSVLGIGDHVGEAPGADREDLSGFLRRVAERVQSGTSLGAEDEVARSQLLFAVLVPEDGTPLRTKNISSAPKCICIRIPVAPASSSYSVAPILASSGRQKKRCRVPNSLLSPSQTPENRF
jgi:hypothetical protein